MIARKFKRYPAYRDSGMEWMGEIPVHWDLRRLKTLAAVQLSNVDKKSLEGQVPVRLCNYTDVYYHERITNDLEFMAATATPEQVSKFTLCIGDVLITKDSESWTDIAVPAVVSEDLPGVLCGYHLAHIRPKPDCHGTYLARAFSAVGPRDQFQVAANGITRFGLGGDSVATGVFAMPTEPEQRAIAAFLDRETTRIDALVAKKERLIGLLYEKRTALITRAVTKGLDPNVSMKDSGIEWLGEIPTHWEVKALGRTLWRITYGFTNPMPVADEGPFMLTALDIGDGRVLYENARRTTEEAFQRLLTDKSRPRADDLLLTKDGTLGRIAVADGRHTCINQSVAVLRFNPTVEVEFMQYALRSVPYQERMVFEAGGTAIKHIYISRLRRMPVAQPAKAEQRAITAFLKRQEANIDALTSKVCDAIERLRELRTALVSAAVTGKLDVREEVST